MGLVVAIPTEVVLLAETVVAGLAKVHRVGSYTFSFSFIEGGATTRKDVPSEPPFAVGKIGDQALDFDH